MALVIGSIVVEVAKGVVYTMPVVTDCVSGAGEEERMLPVGDVITLVLRGEGGPDSPESHASVGTTEEGIGGVVVSSVWRESVGRSVVGFSVVSPVNVAAWLGKGEGSVPVAAEVGGGGPVGVEAVSVVRVVVVVRVRMSSLGGKVSDMSVP